jgi:hypothetical protein
MMRNILIFSFFTFAHIIRIISVTLSILIILLSIAYLYPDYYKSIVMLRFSVLISLSSIIFAYVMYRVGNKFISISKANNVT